MIICGQQDEVKFTHLIVKDEENNKYYVKFRKVFKELYKTIKEFISNNVAEPFYLKRTQRTLGLQKGAQVALKKHLSTPKALQGH